MPRSALTLFATLIATSRLCGGCKCGEEQGGSRDLEGMQGRRPRSEPKASEGPAGEFTSPLAGQGRSTTAPDIAVQNLEFQIERARKIHAAAPDDVRYRAGLAGLLLSRARFLGRLDDYDEADRLSAGAVATATASVEALLLRADVDGALHRFGEALERIDRARALGASEGETRRRRATILVALGRAGEVIDAMERDATDRPSFSSLALWAAALSALERFDEAERVYLRALEAYRDVSPFPVAWVYFERGKMWSEESGDRERGKRLYERAIEHLPRFVTAEVHLAEIEAELGATANAIRRLRDIIPSTDDPEPRGLLGALLIASGAEDEGARLVTQATRRYDALLARHPKAFADHGAEFFLGPGKDPERAWRLAAANAENRPTPRALALAIRAGEGSGRREEACRMLARATGLSPGGSKLGGAARALLTACGQTE